MTRVTQPCLLKHLVTFFWRIFQLQALQSPAYSWYLNTKRKSEHALFQDLNTAPENYAVINFTKKSTLIKVIEQTPKVSQKHFKY